MLVGWRRDPLTCRQLQIRDGDTSKLRDRGILRTVLNIIDIIAYKLLGWTSGNTEIVHVVERGWCLVQDTK